MFTSSGQILLNIALFLNLFEPVYLDEEVIKKNLKKTFVSLSFRTKDSQQIMVQKRHDFNHQCLYIF